MAQKGFVYVLGHKVIKDNSVKPTIYTQLMDIGSFINSHFVVKTNFKENAYEECSLATFESMIEGAEVINVLCHGIVEEDGGMYLQVGEKPLGVLRPSDVSALRLPRGALVFVNACSSAGATYSVAGLTTFGWEFWKAGAAFYIGTLAPVMTDFALRFAKAFYDAWLGSRLSIPEAMFEARRSFRRESNPMWTLYALYGDVHLIDRQV
jgi:hypothetical protein